ncbi:hypothetical protein BU26DRAFT_553584 [Trematosphaeria pertusa]|uniref:N-acetyltransferase domain-containing protein n=1 Tax=Trematosphaeria pertusa TaxID=390896 RepID=A0A6A6I5Z8_9PLEO|nr:uncharacterized protein BU26DRAFT_553584 [Trematosphaeria pertusa]KAF2245781.1 hypothetical protein BU26DRAFT_553584 [Trematosphaeria pertusa]
MFQQPSISIKGAAGQGVVRFGEATPDQRLQCYRLALAFGQPLSEEDFVEREEFMSQQPFARGTGWRFWCVFLTDNPSQVLATCKTIQRHLLLKDISGVRDELGYCIASVVTDPSYRGQGVASFLLRHVTQWLDGPGNAAASMLYSSKEDFYAKSGWHPVPDFETTLSAADASKRSASDELCLPKTDPISADGISALCERDTQGLRAEYSAQDIGKESSLMVVLPTAELVSWLHALAEFMGLKTRGKAPVHKGAISNRDTWIYWHHDFRKQCLYVQRIRTFVKESEPRTKALAAVLLHACREADIWELPKVAIWDANPEMRLAIDLLASRQVIRASNGDSARREKLSIRWKDQGMKMDPMIEKNEFYAWN